MAATTKMVLDSDGKVGIGTTNTRSFLTIYGDTTDRGTFSIENADTDIQNGEIIGIINFRSNEAGNPPPTDDIVARIHAVASSQHTADDWNTEIVFSNVNDSNDLVERMRIDSSGNVGIGTTDPSDKLVVNGTFRVINESGQDTKLSLVFTCILSLSIFFLSMYIWLLRASLPGGISPQSSRSISCRATTLGDLRMSSSRIRMQARLSWIC